MSSYPLPSMFSATAWTWIVGVLLAAALGGFVLGRLRDHRKRRARWAHSMQSVRAQHRQRPASSAPAPLGGGMTPEQAAAIRAHAERTADRDCAAARSSAINPYDHGTPEYVLWFATYHLRLADRAEEAEAGTDEDRKQGAQ